MARIVFDKFHLMVLAGQALDEVRRELGRDAGSDLKGALWSLRGNAWNLSEERQEQRKNLCRQYTKLGGAMSLRESLQAIYASPERQVAEAELAWWCGWAARLWDAATGKAVGESLKHPAEVLSAQFSPDGQRLLTASGDKLELSMRRV